MPPSDVRRMSSASVRDSNAGGWLMLWQSGVGGASWAGLRVRPSPLARYSQSGGGDGRSLDNRTLRGARAARNGAGTRRRLARTERDGVVASCLLLRRSGRAGAGRDRHVRSGAAPALWLRISVYGPARAWFHIRAARRERAPASSRRRWPALRCSRRNWSQLSCAPSVALPVRPSGRAMSSASSTRAMSAMTSTSR